MSGDNLPASVRPLIEQIQKLSDRVFELERRLTTGNTDHFWIVTGTIAATGGGGAGDVTVVFDPVAYPTQPIPVFGLIVSTDPFATSAVHIAVKSWTTLNGAYIGATLVIWGSVFPVGSVLQWTMMGFV